MTTEKFLAEAAAAAAAAGAGAALAFLAAAGAASADLRFGGMVVCRGNQTEQGRQTHEVRMHEGRRHEFHARRTLGTCAIVV